MNTRLAPRQLELFDTKPDIDTGYIKQGKLKSPNKYCHTIPRECSKDEIDFVLQALKSGYSKQSIADMLGRSVVSVSVKIKRLKKNDNSYNSDHVSDKYKTNLLFVKLISPNNILDVYCGVNSWYKNNCKECTVITNDKNVDIAADYHMDALKLMCSEYIKGNSYDIVDLDPFGSCYDCIDLALKIAIKGIVVTFGEMGHKRFKRLDFVERYYDIHTLDDFTTDNITNKIITIGIRNKKRLVPIFIKEWRFISRVYFKIEPIKITEQWEKKRNGE